MASTAQIIANRKNALKSTGPKTPEGRDAVRFNGLKHGLTSEVLVLPGESQSDFDNLVDSLEAEHQPVTATEVILVRQMAMASWRIQRVIHMEAAYYSLRRGVLDVHFKSYYDENLREPDRQAIITDHDFNHVLINFSRQEARLERSFHKALTALHSLRAQRKSEMTNQSQFQAAASARQPFSRKMDACRPDLNSTNRIFTQLSPNSQAGPWPKASSIANTSSPISCMPSDSWPLPPSPSRR